MNQIVICVSDSLSKCLLFSFPDTTQILHNGKTAEPFSFLPFLPSIIIHSFLPFPVLFMPSFFFLSSLSFLHSPSLSISLSDSLSTVTGSSFSFLFLSIFHVSFNSQTEYVASQSQVDSLSFHSSLSLPDFYLSFPTISLSLSLSWLNIGLSLSFCLLHQPIPLRKWGVERTNGEE